MPDPVPSLGRTALRTLSVLIPAAFITLIAYGVLARAPSKAIDAGLARGHPLPAPAFSLEVLDRGDRRAAPRALADGRLALRELRGRPVLLNLWASWCGPCRAEMPLLERAWESRQGRGVVFVGIDQQDVRSDARAFLRHFAIGYPTVRDPDDATARAYGATGVPETYFVAPDGRVVGHVVGVIDAPALRSGLRAARLGRPFTGSDGGARKPLP